MKTALFAPLALAALATANILDQLPPDQKNRGQSGVLVSTDTTAYSRGPLASPVSITSALPVTGAPAGESAIPGIASVHPDSNSPSGSAVTDGGASAGSFVVQTTMPTNTGPAVTAQSSGTTKPSSSSGGAASSSTATGGAAATGVHRGSAAAAVVVLAAAALAL